MQPLGFVGFENCSLWCFKYRKSRVDGAATRGSADNGIARHQDVER
jgi:hypothetical protein